MRVFYAIEFEDKVKRYLKNVQDIIKTTTYSGNYTHYTNFHLTIKYVGNIYNGEYEELTAIMDDVCKNIEPFSIRIGDLGAFHKKNSSILWVGITSGKQKLKSLFKELEKEIVESGFEAENRKYRPHITLGKKIVFNNGAISDDLPYFDEPIECSKLTLFQSHRVDGVLTYTPLYQKSFSKGVA
ncbi:RNA 2',3'-cyclic phosphodiesterase [Candidatus Xianfuyuplasma coldseepsis]|uniref:RNA 2',3'-cyclic phosphodiesterase n=1 Tax=Candidatus Xianfuyuplasma coldseepsis TaxID=2782163 RepID=A0A7L7KSQ3_9MOLU|nr:RNA 2',3'-cyclic phosphodiesterase [Xianfuyuplasma coldseepsis]QMS84808.1 RNA 2',3'-cyclic phosphodiesterase [Xianfuyuplasma coldseepsis]